MLFKAVPDSDAALATMTSRQFNQDTARAKRMARQHPVFIKTRGEISHVLLAKAEFDRLTGGSGSGDPALRRSLADALAQPGGEDIEFEVPEFKGVGSGFEFD